MGIVEKVGKNKCLVHGIWGKEWIPKKGIRIINDKRRKATVLREYNKIT